MAFWPRAAARILEAGALAALLAVLFAGLSARAGDPPSERRGATCVAATAGSAAVGGHGGVDLFHGGRWAPLGGKRNVFALAFTGGRLLEAGGQAGERGRVLAWDFKAGKLLWAAEPHADVAYAVAAAGARACSGGADGAIAVLELESGRPLGRLEGHAAAVLALAAAPVPAPPRTSGEGGRGSVLASGSADRSIRLWDPAALKPLRAIHSHADKVHALAWSQDGQLLASGSADRTVRIWQPSIGRLLRIVRGHEGGVLALAYAGGRLASGSADGKARLIDGESDAVLAVLDGHADWVVGLAPWDGGLLSADWSGRVILWRDGKPGELR